MGNTTVNENFRVNKSQVFLAVIRHGTKKRNYAVAHGHQAVVSINNLCQGIDLNERLDPMVNLQSAKMGIHEWSYDSEVESDLRYVVPQADKKLTLTNRKKEVELGFDPLTGFKEAQRCLNCDVQTVFTETKCIECDACMDVCPTACITFGENLEEEVDLRSSLKMPALNKTQDIYVADVLPTKRVMIKDENVCLHCGLCAERCPTAAWDMQKFFYNVTKTHTGCQKIKKKIVKKTVKQASKQKKVAKKVIKKRARKLY